MATVDVLDLSKKKVGTIELNDSVFNTEVNIPLVHQVLHAQLAGRRQGTQKTLTKREVRGGGKKPFKQKGTGNARQGSSRSPLQPGGGVALGPQPRSYEQRTPKKMMAGALRSVLSDRFQSQRLLVLDHANLPEVKTKSFAKIFKDLGLEKALIVDAENKNLELSARNLRGVKVLRSEGLNVYDVVKSEWLVMTKRAIEAAQKRLVKE